MGFCSILIKKEFVGHMTHSNYASTKFISYQDFNLVYCIQHYVFYKTPIRDSNASGELLDVEKTINLLLNVYMIDGRGAQFLIHRYSVEITITDNILK